MGVDIEMQVNLAGRIISTMTWTGHKVRMNQGRLLKKTETMKQPGCTKRRRR